MASTLGLCRDDDVDLIRVSLERENCWHVSYNNNAKFQSIRTDRLV